MRLSAEAAAAVDPVAVLDAMLQDVEQGRLQQPRCVAEGKEKGDKGRAMLAAVMKGAHIVRKAICRHNQLPLLLT